MPIQRDMLCISRVSACVKTAALAHPRPTVKGKGYLAEGISEKEALQKAVDGEFTSSGVDKNLTSTAHPLNN